MDDVLPRTFPRHVSTVVETADAYKENAESWPTLLQKFNDALEWSAGEGEEKYVTRHHARGMLSARDRIALVLDEDSPFLELAPLAGFEVKGSSPSASSICGIGLVHGIIVMVTANVPTLDGGSSNEMTVLKAMRGSQIAMENDIPVISLVQSAGANLPQQYAVFHRGGTMFRDLAIRSQKGTPSCSVVFGSSTAGGAYQPGMSDYTIFIKGQSQVFLGGPPLVKMATGEVTDAETLGGAEMHSTVSGVSDALAADEFEALDLARRWVLTINRAQTVPPGVINPIPRPATVLEPFFDPEQLLGIVPTNIRQPMNMTEVIARIVDDSRFQPFKPLYGPTLLCAWAHIHGNLVGIVANQSPVIFTAEAEKAVQFIRLCNNGNMPIIFLHNVTGFMVGKKTEREGIIKAGSQFINAVSNSGVPHISIICGASYGAGNYAMCGRAYNPRFLFSWPQSRCSVMGPDQLSGVMETIAREAAARAKIEIEEEVIKKRTAGMRDRIDNESSAWYTSARLIDDGIIDPRDTRTVLGMCLEVVKKGARVEGNRGFRGVSRL